MKESTSPGGAGRPGGLRNQNSLAWRPTGHVPVDEFDFQHNSYIHGLSHSLRVMHGVLRIAARGGEAMFGEEVVREAWCAAVIHDMARRHDGHCDQHGTWAAEEKLPAWWGRFVDWGVKESGRERIAFAVIHHCKPRSEWTTPPSGGLAVLQLLQDADALDRVRFRGWCEADRMDVRRLHHPFVADLEEEAFALFRIHAEVERWSELPPVG